ncbi:MAG TPA: Dabb family protein [Candidatus Dormibacteraeota bacterium]|nr:Dabb family protein [Candidatus Dormibacteraeota bacterium]
MVRHIALIKLRSDSPPGAARAAAQGLESLPAQIDAIRAFSVGTDLGVIAEDCDLALVADFASQADYLVYADHPAHRQVIEELIEPFLLRRYRGQIEVAG